ncbi:hypothetical protein, partial [Prosthecobacter sp.]|uniref:hypothetical protein n=1 Tax=Prosthecobacter sp. TaxID=1965333 RepID=UPI002489687E
KPVTKPEAVKSIDSETRAAAVTPVFTSPQPVAARLPPATADKQPAKDAIIIRRAIVPSKEEIDRMKQGQVENQTGQMPAISTASTLPPKLDAAP